MDRMTLQGSWFVNVPKGNVYEIMSDFEAMPKNFPGVADSLKIINKEGNNLVIHGVAKAFGRKFDVEMHTELLPGKGFRSKNNSPIVKDGLEEFLLEDEGSGTRINYSYEITVKNKFLRLIAKPLFGGFSMWRWKKLVIDKLESIANSNTSNN
ncbi:hypothetical protein KC909_06570 [Candidatus Dojkabacteria bacterium]|uniref:Coenzyme Q-binding protein COQ10 START domain-containing protein n=1 Tax=Candidatus Dojkabacteria bacterium TaxID=2099670 RepID=A0A955RJJ3_9BACT|nr:hypothetical protein [Candidatus Dojkabacteria bacterium]